MTAGGFVSTVAHTVATPVVSTSFVYEDLIFHIQVIQRQIIEITKFIDEQQKNERKIQNELKSRSLTVIDPYGNSVVNTYMDHEIIDTILKKFKKNYVPKYLQKWIKIGTKTANGISLLTDTELKSTVSKYEDGHQFITYGEVPVWIGNYVYSSPRLIILQCLVTDNIEKIKIQLKEERQIANIELKSLIINQNTKLNKDSWQGGKTLRLEDTIISSQLYQDNCITMAKFISKEVSDNVCSFNFILFVTFPIDRSYRFHYHLSSVCENSHWKNSHFRSEL